MARVRKYMNLINGWEQVVAASEALPHLESSRVKLQGLITQARAKSTQQASYTATRQQITKDLQQTLRSGQFLVSMLRAGAKEHFGPDNEKLVEFGMQPFRGQSRSLPPPEGPEDVKPAPDPET